MTTEPEFIPSAVEGPGPYGEPFSLDEGLQGHLIIRNADGDPILEQWDSPAGDSAAAIAFLRLAVAHINALHKAGVRRLEGLAAFINAFRQWWTCSQSPQLTERYQAMRKAFAALEGKDD